MSRDLAILDEVAKAAAPPTLRFYTWSPPALSLGYFQQAEDVADIEACRRLGIEIVRRPTGGRALLHHRELTYSVAVPEGHPLIPTAVLPAYKFLSSAIINGLSLLGVEADLSAGENRGRGKAPGSCFDTPSAYEIQIGGKKVVGSAQLRRNGALLQHGSILLELSLDLYRHVLRHDCREDNYIDILGKRAAGLHDLGYNTPIEDLTGAMVSGFSELLSTDFLREDL
jgi:lipoate-protein ligase A